MINLDELLDIMDEQEDFDDADFLFGQEIVDLVFQEFDDSFGVLEELA